MIVVGKQASFKARFIVNAVSKQCPQVYSLSSTEIKSRNKSAQVCKNKNVT